MASARCPMPSFEPMVTIASASGSRSTAERLPAGPSVCKEATTVAGEPLGREDDPCARPLEDERRLTVQRLGLLSLIALSAFFPLYTVRGVVLGTPYWAGAPRLFGVYW